MNTIFLVLSLSSFQPFHDADAARDTSAPSAEHNDGGGGPCRGVQTACVLAGGAVGTFGGAIVGGTVGLVGTAAVMATMGAGIGAEPIVWTAGAIGAGVGALVGGGAGVFATDALIE